LGIGIIVEAKHNIIEISCNFLCTSVPDSEPQLLMASDITSESFYLSWSPPPVEDHNGVITGYTIQVTNASTGEIFTVTSQENSTEIQSLRPFTTYTCVVAAQTSAGIGPYSTTVMIQTGEAGESGYDILL
jgi:receptor-type tyrosine-protein phosphatase Q